MNIEVTVNEEIKSIQCINCFECITVCPVAQTMSFGFVKIRDKAFLKSILSIKSLIIVFILLISFFGFSIVEEAVFTGRGMGFRAWITVSVTIVNDLITDIVVTDHNDDNKWFNRAYRKIPHRIIESQSTDIDVVSGATYSSMGIIDAVKDALGEE